MWNKEKQDSTAYAPRQPEVIEAAPQPERPLPPKAPSGFALIGRSISINGDVTGDEDLVIQGRVQGSVNLKQHSVTVGKEGEVKADIFARIVTVEGAVVGNLSGHEQVVLRASAKVQGDIVSPRVVLEDGTLFRGSVEMGEVKNQPKAATVAAAPPAEKKSEPAAKAAEAPRPVASTEESVKTSSTHGAKAGARA